VVSLAHYVRRRQASPAGCQRDLRSRPARETPASPRFCAASKFASGAKLFGVVDAISEVKRMIDAGEARRGVDVL
jgi:hypothetical protein